MTEPAAAHRPGPSAVVVLAAGSGTRMKSKRMKVLHQLCGRSMIGHVLTAAHVRGREGYCVGCGAPIPGWSVGRARRTLNADKAT